MTTTLAAEPFAINIADSVLADLAERLGRAHWPDEVGGAGWDYGTNGEYLRELVDHWRKTYDWRAAEARLNRWDHYRALVGGQRVHFIRRRGTGPRPMPILLSHGWPSSFWEMTRLIEPLADPGSHGGDAADAFDVVVLSLPGYGFSDAPRAPGANVERLAAAAHELMTSCLGYERYGVQGGDWAGFIASRIGFDHPESVIGLHLNSVSASPHPDRRQGLTDAERAWVKKMRTWYRTENGYLEIQATKPQTLAYGLTDSPVGLCGWIIEKFRSWSDCGGDFERLYTKDDLLTNVTIYWVTRSIASACRLYYEDRHHPWRLGPDDRITVPTGVAAFPAEIVCPPREWAERVYNVTRWTEMPRGGHFPALEQPALLVEDIRAFFRTYR